MGDWVTAPSMEIADDLDAVRLGVHQRWQTKRGPPDNRHIVDWIELDTDVTFFPNPDRDNFGSVAGLLDYNFIWHVGDRLTLVSEGMFDFFDRGAADRQRGGVPHPAAARLALRSASACWKARSTAKWSPSPTATG